MTHFTTLVVGPTSHEEVYEAIAPFQSNDFGTVDQSYLTFVDEDGSPADETTCKNGYWRNLNAEWDWYVLGGRWNRSLLLRPTATPPYGRNRVSLRHIRINHPEKYQKGSRWMDFAKVGDIDWEQMRIPVALGNQWVTVEWNRHSIGVNMNPQGSRDWESEFTHLEPIDRDDFIRMVTSRNLPDTVDTYRRWVLGDPTLLFKDKPEFADVVTRFSTYAYVKDGVWRSCLMAGMGYTSKDKTWAWRLTFKEMLDSLSPDTVIWVLDCHM